MDEEEKNSTVLDKNTGEQADEVYEDTENKSDQESSGDSGKTMTERAAEEIEARLQKQQNDIVLKNQKQQERIAKNVKDHEKELEAKDRWEQAHLEMQGFLDQKKNDLLKNQNKIRSYRSKQRNLQKQKKEEELRIEGYNERTMVLYANLRQHQEEAVTCDRAIAELSGKTGFFAERKRKKYEDRLKMINVEIGKDSEEYTELPEKIQNSTKRIGSLTQEIKKNEEELKQLSEEVERQKIEYRENQSAYKEDEKKNEQPDWYLEYKSAKEELAQSEQEYLSVQAQKENAMETARSMQTYQITDEDGNTYMAMLGETGEYYSERGEKDKIVKAMAEEKKVESEIKAAPIFKVVNKDTITETQNYNPKTGQKDEEGGKTDDSGAAKVLAELSEENIMSIKTSVAAIKESTVVIRLNQLFPERVANLNYYLDGIASFGLDMAKPLAAGTHTFLEYAKGSKADLVLAMVGDILADTLAGLLDFSDKGEEKTYFQDLGFEKGESSYATQGATIAWGLEKLVGLLNSGTILSAAASIVKQFVPSSLKSSVKHAKNGLKDAIAAGEQFANALYFSDEIKSQKLLKNADYERLMIGAKNAAYTSGIKSAVSAPMNAAKAAVSFVTTPIKGIGGTLIRSGTSLAFSAVNAILNALIGWGMGKKDKKEIFQLPQVFGNVKYDTDLVNDDKFDEILKNVTGITNKDKVYNAIKIMDGVALHSKMMGSITKPDYEVERILSLLGYKDRTKYGNITVNDLIKKTGYSPSGADWRRDLARTLQMEGKEYQTFGGQIGAGVSGVWKEAKAGVKTGFGLRNKKTPQAALVV